MFQTVNTARPSGLASSIQWLACLGLHFAPPPADQRRVQALRRARLSAGQTLNGGLLAILAQQRRAQRVSALQSMPSALRVHPLPRGTPPNPSVKLTRYGSQRLAAPGTSGIMPSAAKPRLPPQAAYLKR